MRSLDSKLRNLRVVINRIATVLVVFQLQRSIRVVHAFPTLAGSCIGGDAAVGGPHTTNSIRFNGTLFDLGVDVLVGNHALSIESINNPLTFETGTDYPIEIRSIYPYKGLLVRIQDLDRTIDLSTSIVPGNNTKIAEACTSPVGGIDHLDATYKPSSTGTIIMNEPATVIFDITVVIFNNATASVYGYSQYYVTFDGPSFVAESTISDIPSIVPISGSTIPSTEPSLLPISTIEKTQGQRQRQLKEGTSSSSSDYPSLAPSDIPITIPSNIPSFVPTEISKLEELLLPGEDDTPSTIPSWSPDAIASDIPSTFPSFSPDNLSDLPSTVPDAQVVKVKKIKVTKKQRQNIKKITKALKSLINDPAKGSIPLKGQQQRSRRNWIVNEHSTRSDAEEIANLGRSLKTTATTESDAPSSIPSLSPILVASDIPSTIPSYSPDNNLSDVPSTIPEAKVVTVQKIKVTKKQRQNIKKITKALKNLVNDPAKGQQQQRARRNWIVNERSDVDEIANLGRSLKTTATTESDAPSSIPSLSPVVVASDIPSTIPSYSPDNNVNNNLSDVPSTVPEPQVVVVGKKIKVTKKQRQNIKKITKALKSLIHKKDDGSIDSSSPTKGQQRKRRNWIINEHYTRSDTEFTVSKEIAGRLGRLLQIEPESDAPSTSPSLSPILVASDTPSTIPSSLPDNLSDIPSTIPAPIDEPRVVVKVTKKQRQNIKKIAKALKSLIKDEKDITTNPSKGQKQQRNLMEEENYSYNTDAERLLGIIDYFKRVVATIRNDIIDADEPSAVPSDIPSLAPSDVPSTVPSYTPFINPKIKKIDDKTKINNKRRQLDDQASGEDDEFTRLVVGSLDRFDERKLGILDYFKHVVETIRNDIIEEDQPSALPSDIPSLAPSDVPSTVPSLTPFAVNPKVKKGIKINKRQLVKGDKGIELPVVEGPVTSNNKKDKKKQEPQDGSGDPLSQLNDILNNEDIRSYVTVYAPVIKDLLIANKDVLRSYITGYVQTIISNRNEIQSDTKDYITIVLNKLFQQLNNKDSNRGTGDTGSSSDIPSVAPSLDFEQSLLKLQEYLNPYIENIINNAQDDLLRLINESSDLPSMSPSDVPSAIPTYNLLTTPKTKGNNKKITKRRRLVKGDVDVTEPQSPLIPIKKTKKQQPEDSVAGGDPLLQFNEIILSNEEIRSAAAKYLPLVESVLNNNDAIRSDIKDYITMVINYLLQQLNTGDRYVETGSDIPSITPYSSSSSGIEQNLLTIQEYVQPLIENIVNNIQGELIQLVDQASSDFPSIAPSSLPTSIPVARPKTKGNRIKKRRLTGNDGTEPEPSNLSDKKVKKQTSDDTDPLQLNDILNNEEMRSAVSNYLPLIRGILTNQEVRSDIKDYVTIIFNNLLQQVTNGNRGVEIGSDIPSVAPNSSIADIEQSLLQIQEKLKPIIDNIVSNIQGEIIQLIDETSDLPSVAPSDGPIPTLFVNPKTKVSKRREIIEQN